MPLATLSNPVEVEFIKAMKSFVFPPLCEQTTYAHMDAALGGRRAWNGHGLSEGATGATSNEAARANFPGNCSHSGNVYKLLAGMRRYDRIPLRSPMGTIPPTSVCT